tara:strand:- start:2635 stop:3216 length:582 start_codon:yes stop_codon:yes gene_type:complete
MPIIKDKYAGKGSITRPKYVTRKENRAKMEEAPTGVLSQQKAQVAASEFRSDERNRSEVYSSNFRSQSLAGSLYMKQTKANTLQELLVLNPGQSVKGIFAQNNTVSESKVAFYLTYGNPADLDVHTVTDGKIDSFGTSGDGKNRPHLIYVETIPVETTVSISDITTIFEGLKKPLYIYVTAGARLNITYKIDA